jgi:hypothetical protein
MQPIAQIARGTLNAFPEFVSLRMPSRHVQGAAFITKANSMAEAAAVHSETLIERGLPPRFIDDFRSATAALQSSLGARDASWGRRLGATKGLETEQKEGRTVLHVLDALVRRALADNEPLLREWQGARKIRKRGGPTAGQQTTPATPEPAATPVKAVTEPVDVAVVAAGAAA